MHTLTVYYRPDNYPDWTLWRDFPNRFEMIGKPGDIDAGGIPTTRAGFAPRVPLGKPAIDSDPTTSRKLTRGFDFQIKFRGSGHVVFDRFRLHAQRIVERSTAKL